MDEEEPLCPVHRVSSGSSSQRPFEVKLTTDDRSLGWLWHPTYIRWTASPPHLPLLRFLKLIPSSSLLTSGSTTWQFLFYATSTVFGNSYSGSITTAAAIIIAVGKPLMAKLADV